MQQEAKILAVATPSTPVVMEPGLGQLPRLRSRPFRRQPGGVQACRTYACKARSATGPGGLHCRHPDRLASGNRLPDVPEAGHPACLPCGEACPVSEQTPRPGLRFRPGALFLAGPIPADGRRAGIGTSLDG